MNLEQYIYNDVISSYIPISDRWIAVPVHTVSMGAELSFKSLEGDTVIYVEMLTDLDNDDHYEWIDSDGGLVRLELSSNDTLTNSNKKPTYLTMGDTRTLSAAQLLAYGMTMERSRMADSSSPVEGLSLMDSGALVYCITTITAPTTIIETADDEETKTEDKDETDIIEIPDVPQEVKTPTTQTYYVCLDRNLPHDLTVQTLGAGNFSDVPSWSWYWERIDWAVREGLLSGATPTTFEPEGGVTRSALIQALYCMAGKPTAPDVDFTDVTAESDWYYDAVAWASEIGLTSGYEDGSFRPNDLLTREEMAVILYQYIGIQVGIELSEDDDNEDEDDDNDEKSDLVEAEIELSEYPDADAIYDWAKIAMAWVIDEEILSVKDGGMLAPKATATRGELADILYVVEEKIHE